MNYQQEIRTIHPDFLQEGIAKLSDEQIMRQAAAQIINKMTYAELQEIFTFEKVDPFTEKNQDILNGISDYDFKKATIKELSESEQVKYIVSHETLHDLEPNAQWNRITARFMKEIDRIDKITPWAQHEPNWWVRMMEVQRTILNMING